MCTEPIGFGIQQPSRNCNPSGWSDLLVSQFWLAIVAFRPALGKPAGEILVAFYVGEIGKFVVTALLFLVVFTQFSLFKQPIYALLIFIAYALVQSMAWVYPLARSRLFKN